MWCCWIPRRPRGGPLDFAPLDGTVAHLCARRHSSSEGGQIDKGFEGRAGLPPRLGRSIERAFIVIDAAEQVVDIPVLQFPLWLAFAAGPGEISTEEEFY